MDWDKFLAIATLAIFCAEEICDYIRGEHIYESCQDRIDTAIGGAKMMVDTLKEELR